MVYLPATRYDSQDLAGVGVVKLTDFGLALTLEEMNDSMPGGTGIYKSPEQLSGERCGGGVDVWAFGCALYFMLCGGHAFYCRSARSSTEELDHAGCDDFVPNGEVDDPEWDEERLLDRAVHFPSPEWDDISDSAKNLISHMLLVDLAWRYDIGEVLAHPWLTARSQKRSARRVRHRLWRV